MASSSRKKVLIRRFSGVVTPGYLPAAEFVRHGSIDLLDLDGRVNSLPINDIKMVCYVREFNLADRTNPERLLRKTFLARPRGDGLWVKMTFRDGDLLEGLAVTDVTLLDTLLVDGGLQVTPPDTRSNTQRIYVPRAALTAVELVAVINSQSRRKPSAAETAPTQEELFHGDLPPNTRPN
jgi:hypothetical protein